MTARSLIARSLRASALLVAFYAGCVLVVADLVDPGEAVPYDDADAATRPDDLADDDAEPAPADGAPLDGSGLEALGGPASPTREETSARVGHLGNGSTIGRSIDADIATLCAAHGVVACTWFDPDGHAVHWRIERGDRFVTRMISERDLCERPDPHGYAMELMREDLAEIEGGLN